MSAVICRPEFVVTVNVASCSRPSAETRRVLRRARARRRVDELPAQLGAQVGTEPVAEYIVAEIEERDVLVGPLRDDLARELDPTGPAPTSRTRFACDSSWYAAR